jgi:magnesium transporter
MDMARKSKKKPNPARAAQKALVQGLRITRRIVRPRVKPPGAAPGTIVHTGEQRVEQTILHLIRYSPDHFEERDVAGPAECFPPPPGTGVTWLNIDGLHDTALLQDLGTRAGLHPLVLEDVVSIGQRPKQEEYPPQHYIVLRMLDFDTVKREITEEQISLVVGPNYVLSFQEAPGDVWDPVRERLRNNKGTTRARGADYLAYALMDAIVDAYFHVVERVGDHLEELETDVMEQPSRRTVGAIHHLKGELLIMRKATWPLRDVFNSLLRDESSIFSHGIKVYVRDLYDHAVQVIDTVETMRDITAGLIDLYLSSVSNRMNEIMKVLTVIATLFIPLTFIVGVYGMNFDYMPELHWRYGYFGLWGIMLAVLIVMLAYFKRNHWL